jgi:hypothetical protein
MIGMNYIPSWNLDTVPYHILQSAWQRRLSGRRKTRGGGKKSNPTPIRLTKSGKLALKNDHSGLRGKRHACFMIIKDGMTVADYQTAAAPILKTGKTQAGMTVLHNRALYVLKILIGQNLCTVAGMKGIAR